jgi:TetR/AcrR family transcriptional regulator, ethionamide resistance regulator
VASQRTVGSRRPAPPSRGDGRRDQILDAAETLFEVAGYDALTMAAIAQRVGITRPSLYFYFDSKQAVMTALVQRSIDRLTAMPIVESEAETREIVHGALAATALRWREETAVMRFAAQHSYDVPEVGALWQAALDVSAGWVQHLAEREGVTEPGSASAPTLGAVLVAMTERSFWQLHSRPHTRRDERELLAALEQVFVATLRRVDQPWPTA